MAGLSGSLRWAVVIVDLDPAEGHEQAGERRAEPRYPGDVPIASGEAGETRDGVVLTSQVRTISLRRVRSAPIGVVTDADLRRSVRAALAHH